MIPKHNDLNIDPETPFSNCQLERQQYAEILTEMIQNHSEGFVLAINNKWGTGKTTFVRMWNQYLKNQDYKTLYFNAWENDFEQDILVALISEFKKLSDSKKDDLYEDVIKKAAPITKKLAITAARSLIDKYIGKDFTKEVLKTITEGTIEGLESELKSYSERKKNIESFKASLSSYVANVTDDKPIVFIIDELDRCRPSYAVEFLEQIKHVFSVSKVIFVLSIDKEQLGYAVRGVYGNDNINSDEYLRRFIDIEYSLPEPNTQTFCNYLFNYFEFKKYFQGIRNGNDKYSSFLDFSTSLFKSCNLTLRMQEKIFAHARIAISSFGPNFITPAVYVYLIYLKLFSSDLYNSISNLKITYQELIDETEKIILGGESSVSSHSTIVMEAQLLTLYHNAHSRKFYNSKQKLFERNDDNDTEKFLIKSTLKSDNYNLEEMVSNIRYRSDYSSTPIEHLTKKIDLIEHLRY